MKLSPDVVKKIKHIEICTRRLLSGSFIGENSSAIKGSGLEFDQLREYQQGDDVRFIDWNSSARMNKLLIKQYVEQRSRTIVIAVDVSASANFGTAKENKRDVMAQIGATLSLVAGYAKDNIALLLFTDQVELFIPPGKGRNHMHHIVEQLFAFEAKNKKTNLVSALDHLALLKRRDAIVFLISDFVTDGFEKQLSVVAKMYDLIAVRYLDRYERRLPHIGFITMHDSETGQEYLVDLRKKQGKKLTEFLQQRTVQQNTIFKKYAIDCLTIEQQPFVGELIRFFKRRMMR